MIPVGHKVKKNMEGERKKIQGTAIHFHPDSLVCMNLALINQNLLRLLHNSGMQLCREMTIIAPRPPQQHTFGTSGRIVCSWKTMQGFIDIKLLTLGLALRSKNPCEICTI